MSGTALTRRSAAAVVADAVGARLPAYVTRDQARAVIAAAATTRDRLLFECLWQTGGRVTEVLRLRRGDVDSREGALRLTNLKQRRRALREKLVYVSPDLLRDLVLYAKDLRLGPGDHFFTSQKTDAPGASGVPMTRQHAWWLLRKAAERAGVAVPGRDGRPRPATGLDFRHGAAVHQLRAGVPLSEVQQQLGHARIDTTTIYVRCITQPSIPFAERRSSEEQTSGSAAYLAVKTQGDSSMPSKPGTSEGV